ncbi:hypothetical protein DWG18_13215 [Lysobacter sp. TY2-98]|uniref:hypothetical protein n=1 Tax=Lysobacter sp. TY2-98 TaxID=2290922 RepID=UPI000E20479D|nr:hypothetical protein [Lysobacter sp. TY2-98]AXK73146.1 hypothetical protein DWG18_13215 [Lysobacter sp. TY2-98]
MSKLHGDEPGYEEVRFERGELRKPDDRHDQPGQGAVLTPPTDGHAHDARRDPSLVPRAETQPYPPLRKFGIS